MYLDVANRPHLLGAGVHLYHRDSPWRIRSARSNRAPARRFNPLSAFCPWKDPRARTSAWPRFAGGWWSCALYRRLEM